MLDLYWRAAHGHPIPEEAWPAVMLARLFLGEPYSVLRSLADALAGLKLPEK